MKTEKIDNKSPLEVIRKFAPKTINKKHAVLASHPTIDARENVSNIPTPIRIRSGNL